MVIELIAQRMLIKSTIRKILKLRSIKARLNFIGGIWCIILMITALISLNYFYERYQRDIFYENMITKLKLLRDFHNYYVVKGQTEINKINDFYEVNKAIASYFDERYDKAYSAWHWQVRGSNGSVYRSKSLQDCELMRADIFCDGESKADLKNDYQNLTPLIDGKISSGFSYSIYPLKGTLNQEIRVIISNFVSHQFFPEKFQYSLTGKYIGLEKIGSEIIYITIAILAFLFIGTFMAIYLSTKFGLMPIEKIRSKLIDVKAGQMDVLQDEFPNEITPLVNEFHDVIQNFNRIEVENLAHNLKTPLSVLFNESEKIKGEQSKIIYRQAKNISLSLDHYLNRLQRKTKLADINPSGNVRNALNISRQNLSYLLEQNQVQMDITCDENIKAVINELDLIECVQEIITNAIKSARSIVRVNSVMYGNYAVINIEDDGQGITKELRDDAVIRNIKLDSKTDGYGIGLSSANSRINSYNGSIVLKTSELGGLRVVITLPSV